MKYLYLLLISVLIIPSLQLSAQEYLPWSTNFDSAAERDAWTEYRTGSTEFFNWQFQTAPNGYPSHDYPVGNTGTDSTIDWMVSPEIYFHSSSKLALSTNLFVLIGSAPEDHFEVWMSTGSKDPMDGDYQMILDMTNFGSNGVWSDTSGIVLSDTGLGYVAFVYEATNNWFTAAFDSVIITPDTPIDTADTANGISLLQSRNEGFNLWPNPASDRVSISNTGMEGTVTATIIDARGAIRLEEQWNAASGTLELDLDDLPSGTYIVKLSNADAIRSERLIIQ